MKKSEQLRLEAASEDNDFKAMRITSQMIREKRLETFQEKWLEKVSAVFTVVERPNGSYSITTDRNGIIDYYPKANKVLVRKDNKWHNNGLNFLRIISTMRL